MLFLELFHITKGENSDQAADNTYDQDHDHGKIVNCNIGRYVDAVPHGLFKPENGRQLYQFQKRDPGPFKPDQRVVQNHNSRDDIQRHDNHRKFRRRQFKKLRMPEKLQCRCYR